MRTALSLAFALLVAGCASVKPVPISAADLCFRCQRPIVETRLAGEVINSNGIAMKFRTVQCMATFLAERPQPVRVIYVTDYLTGKPIRAGSATFVRTVIDERTGERDYMAFSRVQDALAHAKRGARPVDWSTILRDAGSEPAN